MRDVRTGTTDEGPISVLFSPDALFVIDVFRALGDFEEHYDVAALDQLEAELARHVDRTSAKGLVSDALLLAFGLRRERSVGLNMMTIGRRRGSLDEYRLYAMVAASYWHDHILAAEAAHALGLRHARPLLTLAFDVARRLEAAGIRLEMPNANLLLADARPSQPGRRDRERVEVERTRPLQAYDL